MNIEKRIIKDNLRQNGKKKDVEKRLKDNLKGKKPKRNERGEDSNTSKNPEVSKNTFYQGNTVKGKTFLRS